jgi:hypothetical protein
MDKRAWQLIAWGSIFGFAVLSGQAVRLWGMWQDSGRLSFFDEMMLAGLGLVVMIGFLVWAAVGLQRLK